MEVFLKHQRVSFCRGHPVVCVFSGKPKGTPCIPGRGGGYLQIFLRAPSNCRCFFSGKPKGNPNSFWGHLKREPPKAGSGRLVPHGSQGVIHHLGAKELRHLNNQDATCRERGGGVKRKVPKRLPLKPTPKRVASVKGNLGVCFSPWSLFFVSPRSLCATFLSHLASFCSPCSLFPSVKHTPKLAFSKRASNVTT